MRPKTLPRCFVGGKNDKCKQTANSSIRALCTSYVITRSSATAESTARPSCLVGVLYDISREKIC